MFEHLNIYYIYDINKNLKIWTIVRTLFPDLIFFIKFIIDNNLILGR